MNIKMSSGGKLTTLEGIIRGTLKENKPDVTDSSIKTYTSILKNLYRRVFGDAPFSLEKFNATGKVMDFLKDMEGKKRKTILAALVAICGSDKCDVYRKQMIEDSQLAKIDAKAQTMNHKEKTNWVEDDDLIDIIETHEDFFKGFLKAKSPIKDDYLRAQNFIILVLTTGKYGMPPRRSADWCHMKWRNFDIDNDNVYDKDEGVFTFNKYKTKKYLGTQKLLVPKEMKTILNKWIAKLPDGVDTLIFDSNGNPLTAVTLNQRLNKIFGKKVGTSMLRHMFVTEEYGNIPGLRQMEENAKMMGQKDLGTHLEYLRKR